MKTVVITGSTRGIGQGMALEFLKRGCRVMISGRKKERVDIEVKKFAKAYGKEKVGGQPCEITSFEQIQALWDAALKAFGVVDIWINNAGVTHPTMNVRELEPADIKNVVDTNITGLMYANQVALRGMTAQGYGFIYNMEGHGSHDEFLAGLSVYGASKRAVTYFTNSLLLELDETPVKAGMLSPGIVLTDFIIDGMRRLPPERFETAKIVYNCLADTVETVTPWLVENMLANDESGKEIAWLDAEKTNERFNSDEYCSRDMLSQFGL
ncbi:MAG: SDR family NAD(P)-dependent oxidoreductase [Proteobacteria bacterium]|nr:SDR family NAD(P)-dependent oxidoreductase [Pseudomonadota bacterium]